MDRHYRRSIDGRGRRGRQIGIDCRTTKSNGRAKKREEFSHHPSHVSAYAISSPRSKSCLRSKTHADSHFMCPKPRCRRRSLTGLREFCKSLRVDVRAEFWSLLVPPPKLVTVMAQPIAASRVVADPEHNEVR